LGPKQSILARVCDTKIHTARTQEPILLQNLFEADLKVSFKQLGLGFATYWLE